MEYFQKAEKEFPMTVSLKIQKYKLPETAAELWSSAWFRS